MTAHDQWHTDFDTIRIPADWPPLGHPVWDQQSYREPNYVAAEPRIVQEPSVYVLLREEQGDGYPAIFIGVAATLENCRHLAHDWVMSTGSWQLNPELRTRLAPLWSDDNPWPLWIEQYPLWTSEDQGTGS